MQARLCSAPWQIRALAISKSGVTFLLHVFIRAEYGRIFTVSLGLCSKRAACVPFSVLLRYTLALPPLRVAGCCAGSYVAVYRVQATSRQPHVSRMALDLEPIFSKLTLCNFSSIFQSVAAVCCASVCASVALEAQYFMPGAEHRRPFFLSSALHRLDYFGC